MDKPNLQFLNDLLNAPSPSGSEGPVRRIWCNQLKSIADEVRVDVHGNAIATLNAKGAPHIMLAGHMDEIGLQICHIDESGLMRFRAIGGHDVKTFAGRRVHVHTESGPILAVIGQHPIHLSRDKKSDDKIKVSDFWIDGGFSGRKDAAKVVQIGDPVTYADGFALLRNNLAVARAFDNRVGSYIVARTLMLLKKQRGLKARVSSVATVQEEIGLRGAQTSAYGLNPDVGIAVDVTHATDNPAGDAREIGEVKLGNGPVLYRGPNINPPLLKRMQQAATRARMQIQMRSAPGGTGTDANAIQISRAGVATALVGIPLRYMHSAVEVCHLEDIEECAELIAATILTIDTKFRFIPD